MKFLILILSYLWKNTLKRWFENVISPISKIIVSLLLSLLAVLILVFFLELEDQLNSQLQKTDSFTVIINERITSKNKENVTIAKTIEEQNMWEEFYGEKVITYFRQPIAFINYKEKTGIPVILYSESDKELSSVFGDNDDPTSFFLDIGNPYENDYKVVSLYGVKFSARSHLMPDYIHNYLEKPQVIAIPLSMASTLVSNGSNISIYARFSNLNDVQKFIKQAQAYYKVEKRDVHIVSALEILERIGKIQSLQKYIRIGVVFTCGIILSLILGTIAWLEFRQDNYVLALLRSFGAPTWMLLIHSFFENCLLVAIGINLSFYLWKPIYSNFKSRVNVLELRSALDLNLPIYDIYILLLAGLIGVAIAMIPIAFGLRKRLGLVLQ